MKILFICLSFIWVVSATGQEQPVQVEAVLKTAYQYLHGYMKPYDPGKAFQLYSQCAEAGNGQAMNSVGMQYKLGLGVKADNALSFEWFQKSAAHQYPPAYYNLGRMFKYGTGCELSYEKAYDCFKKAAELGDGGGIYGQGYMLYKGLGCGQDYGKAVTLFRKGAAMGKPSCLYFLGLCFRNGYGVVSNEDSAMVLLNRASLLGYKFAYDELAMQEPENNITPAELIRNVELLQSLQANAKDAINVYKKIDPNISAADVEGVYSGYLVKYDYSGKHIINSTPLNLTLVYEAGKLSGYWLEDGKESVAISAALSKQTILFNNTSYKKTDHYNPVSTQFEFEKADLKLLRKEKSLFLAGNVGLFMVDKKEPERPLSVFLVSKNAGKPDAPLAQVPEVSRLNLVKAYPNPFSSILNIEFILKSAGPVRTEMYTADGKLVYNKVAQKLEAGSYVLPISFFVPAGSYVVKLTCNNEVKSIVVIKE